MQISRRLLAIIVAVVVTVVVYLVATALDADLRVPVDLGNMEETQEMPLGIVVAFTFGLGLVAWALAAILDRFTRHARTIWTIVAVIVMFGSLPSIFQLGVDGAALYWQTSLHLVYGVVLISGFWPTFDRTNEPAA